MRAVANKIKSTVEAIKATLKSKKHLAIAVAFALLMIIVAVYLPTVTIPGNSIEFQISLITLDSAIIMIFFSILAGLSMGMHVYASDVLKQNNIIMLGEEVGTGIAGMFSAMLSGPLCLSCFAVIFGAIGLGSGAALFVVSHRTEIQVLSLLLLSASVYIAGKRINKNCELCKR